MKQTNKLKILMLIIGMMLGAIFIKSNYMIVLMFVISGGLLIYSKR